MNRSLSPKISIVIVAYNRKQYVRSAVNSILNQSVSRELYEIILVKNFQEFELDTFLLENNVIIIKIKNESWGKSLYRGISIATGNIVVFLDDDDEFEQGKLSRITEIFETDNNIVYYHNSYTLISETGKKLRTPLIPKQNRIKVISKENHRQILKVLRQGLFSNLSSVAVKRDFVFSNLQKIRELTAAMDVFIFYMALDSGGFLFFDNIAFSKYYIRKQSAMHSIGDFKSFVLSSKRESFNELQTYQLLSNYLWDYNLLRIVNGIGLQWKIFSLTLDDCFNSKEYLIHYVGFLKKVMTVRPRFTILLSTLIISRLIFRGRTKLIVFMLRTKFLLV